jgi:hypothetical protein
VIGRGGLAVGVNRVFGMRGIFPSVLGVIIVRMIFVRMIFVNAIFARILLSVIVIGMFVRALRAGRRGGFAGRGRRFGLQ